MRHRPSLAVLLTLLCVTGFTGCECASRNPVAPPDPTRRVVRLELSPATDTLVVGDTRTFVAVAHDSTDAVIVGAPVAWSSDDPAVVSVGAGGAAVAVGVAGVFIETHQDPDKAPSDGPNMIPLKQLEALIAMLQEFDQIAKSHI